MDETKTRYALLPLAGGMGAGCLIWKQLSEGFLVSAVIQYSAPLATALLVAFVLGKIKRKLIATVVSLITVASAAFIATPLYLHRIHDTENPEVQKEISLRYHQNPSRVQKLDLNIRETDAERMLWDIFMSHPAVSETPRVTLGQNFENERNEQSRQLIQEAQERNLDGATLASCWQTVLELQAKEDTEIALFPNGAFFVKFESREAWVIVCAWEYRDVSGEQLGHIRAWVIDAKAKNKLGFSTCS